MTKRYIFNIQYMGYEVKIMEPIRHPEIVAHILIGLQRGPRRSKNIVEEVKAEFGISEPTVYSVLKEMEARGFIDKRSQGPKNVQYSLTEEGEEIVMEEFIKAKDSLIEAIERSPQRDGIVFEVFLADVRRKLQEQSIDFSEDSSMDDLLKDMGEPLFRGSQRTLVQQMQKIWEERLIGTKETS